MCVKYIKGVDMNLVLKVTYNMITRNSFLKLNGSGVSAITISPVQKKNYQNQEYHTDAFVQ